MFVCVISDFSSLQIFGVSGKIGRSIAKAALGHNDNVTAVGRAFQDTSTSLLELLPPPAPSDIAEATAPSDSNLLPLLCDVRIRETIDDVFQASLERWGRIDIVANCSSLGILGACEDQDEFDIREQFETNFWGTVNILQLSLPHFRKHGGGRYIIYSGTTGALGVPGLGPFCASKYAVEGLIESMLYETATFNIRATLVEPGHIRLDDGSAPIYNQTMPVNGALMCGNFAVKPASAPYNSPTSPSGHAQRMLSLLGEKQPTSAVKAAELVWQLGHCRYPPLRLLLGGFAIESVRDRLRGITEEIEDWKFLSFQRDDDLKREETSGKAPGQTAGSDVEEDDLDMEDEEEDLDAGGDIGMEEAELEDT